MAIQSPTGRPDPSKPTELITSAGGVVMDPQGRVLLLKRRLEGTWVLPKGRVEPDETLPVTALREVADGKVCFVEPETEESEAPEESPAQAEGEPQEEGEKKQE